MNVLVHFNSSNVSHSKLYLVASIDGLMQVSLVASKLDLCAVA